MARQTNATKQWKKKRARDIAYKIEASPDVYKHEPATGPQIRALGIMVERASRRSWSLDPDIPLSQLDIKVLFDVFKGNPPRGAKIATARLLKALSDAITREQRADNGDAPYCYLLDVEREQFERIDPTDHPLYISPMDKLIAKLNDEWEDYIHDEDERERERVEHQAAVDAFLNFDCDEMSDDEIAIADRDLAEDWEFDPIAEQWERDHRFFVHMQETGAA